MLSDNRRDMRVASESSSLTDIFRDMPFGLTVARTAGPTVFTNAAGNSCHSEAPVQDVVDSNGRVTRTLTFTFPSGGAQYEARLALDMTDQHHLENELFGRAYFDELTGLPTRGLMERCVAAEIDNGAGRGFALAFVDLDGFKKINDCYGHAVGDLLLAKFAERLSAELRSTDILARIGGDEFLLLLSPVADIDVASYAAGLLERLKDPFLIEENEIFCSASIGVSLYPRDGSHYDVLRANADGAMYRHKNDRRGKVSFFNPDMERTSAREMQIEQQLRLAIRDRRLCCAYQPKVDFRSHEVVGVEALLRWRDEEGIIRAPGDFISAADELGLMEDICSFVLNEATQSIDRISEAFGSNTTISINVAAKLAAEFSFMRDVVGTLASTGKARRFMLEITEDAFISHQDFQNRIMPMIRDAGTLLSIDDFGAGYSSLSALSDITADELKVDRAFVRDIHKRPRSQSVLKAIESLGDTLGMAVVVEGVETVEELAYLQAATRIRCAQGFYFCKPLLLEDVTEFNLGRTQRTLSKGRLVPIARLPVHSDRRAQG